MFIKSVEIKNFRSIREALLECDNLTAIVGRNGAGKSSFLYAIETFYDIAAPITEEDFFDRDTGSPIEIRITYGDLRDEEKDEFRPYIKDDKLIITKRIIYESGRIIQRYYAAALQIPQFAEIRSKSSKRERVSSWNELVDRGELPGLNKKVRRADEIEQIMGEYERNHPELMRPIEREEQFFGPRNIGGGKLDKFTKYVLIPAVREASEEVTGKKGAIYQLIDAIVSRKVNAREDIRKFRIDLEEKVKELYSSENLTELSELGDSISQTLEKFAPGSKLNLKWDEVKPPEVPLPSAKATLIEDNFEGEISRKGHGLQRALILSLLQHLAMITPIQPIESTTEEVTDKETTLPKSSESIGEPDLILAIEEPELYLHPSRCRYLSDLLFKLAERSVIGLGANTQVIYTTHSSYFVDLHRFDQIRLVKKVPSPDSPALQSTITRFTLEQAARELARICDADPTNFTRESFRARAIPIMNTIVNEGFFADVVVVVEGQSEVGALWKLQEIMAKNWPQLGIVVVPAEGKNNIDRPTVIFRGLSIPTYFIFDGDAHLSGKGREAAKNRNHRYLRLACAPIEDFPDTQVNETWAVFRENLEKTFEEELGRGDFLSIQSEIALELGYDDKGRVLKNIEGAARFVQHVYEKGKRLPKLEQVVEAVTQLAEKSKGQVKKRVKEK